MPPAAIRAQRVQRHLALAAREQELDRRRLRELRRAAEAAVLAVVGAAQRGDGGVERARRRARRRAARARAAPCSRGRIVCADCSISSRCCAPRLARRRRAPARQLGMPWRGSRREVGAGVERHAVGRQERVQRPAAVAGHRLHGVHVDRVDVRALLAVDLDADEALVHQRRDLRVLEGLALHHVAPVAGRVADRDEQRLVLSRARRQRLLAPRVPVDGVVRVLEQVGGGLVRRGGWPSVQGRSMSHHRKPSPPTARPTPSAPTRTPSSPAAWSSARGQIPLDPETGELVEGSIGEQTAPLPREPRGRRRRRGRAARRRGALGIYVTDMSTFRTSTRPTAPSSRATRRRARRSASPRCRSAPGRDRRGHRPPGLTRGHGRRRRGGPPRGRGARPAHAGAVDAHDLRARGRHVALKAENLQRTGSFKVRGARPSSPRSARRLRAAASSPPRPATTRQALAAAARQRGVPLRGLRARRRADRQGRGRARAGRDGPHRRRVRRRVHRGRARARATRAGSRSCTRSTIPTIVAGQGSLGLELLEDVPDLAKVVVPVGGGGLCAGIAIAVKSARPEVEVVGVQVAACAPYPESLRARRARAGDLGADDRRRHRGQAPGRAHAAAAQAVGRRDRRRRARTRSPRRWSC